MTHVGQGTIKALTETYHVYSWHRTWLGTRTASAKWPVCLTFQGPCCVPHGHEALPGVASDCRSDP